MPADPGAEREIPSAGAPQRGGQSRSRPGGATPPSGKGPTGADDRPQAPWHPLPLAELLILIGSIGGVVAFLRGASANGPLLLAAIVAIAIGTVDVTLREHLSGYRSHTLLLSLLPTIAFHSAVVLIGAAFTPLPRVVNVALLPVDVLLGTVLFKLLRARFVDARRERKFRRGR